MWGMQDPSKGSAVTQLQTPLLDGNVSSNVATASDFSRSWKDHFFKNGTYPPPFLSVDKLINFLKDTT